MSQNTRFEKIAHKLYFNVYTPNPDTCICVFLKKYVPQLYPRLGQGKWRAAPPIIFESEHMCIHSFEFDRHPFLDDKFHKGRLEFITKESADNVIGLKDVRLWLDFDSLENANIAFQSLINVFLNVSTKKNIYNIGYSHVAEFIDSSTKSSFNSVQFVLVSNSLLKPKYQIFFRIGIDDIK